MSDATPSSPDDRAARHGDRTEADLADPEYRKGAIALLAALAYGELVSFFTIVQEATFAPRSQDKEALARVATVEFGHYEGLSARLRELGADPHQAMEPFTRPIDDWHGRARPSNWLEALMKVYAGNSIAVDFYREIAALVDPQTRALVVHVLSDGEQVDFARTQLQAAIAADEKVAGRLALWGRRLVGEALSQAQRVAAENDDLTNMLVDDGSGHGLDLAELVRLFARITDRHTRRMEALGLSA